MNNAKRERWFEREGNTQQEKEKHPSVTEEMPTKIPDAIDRRKNIVLNVVRVFQLRADYKNKNITRCTVIFAS